VKQEHVLPLAQQVVTELLNLDNRIDTSVPTPAEITANPEFADPNFIGRVRASVRSNSCVESTIVGVFFNRRPTLTFGDITSGDCSDGPYEIAYTIGNFDPDQAYEFSVNGGVPTPVNGTLGAINNAGLSILGTPPTQTAQGTLTVSDGRRVYDVALTGSANRNCDATDSFRIFQPLDFENRVSAVNCDNEFDTITVEITGGGFEGESNRGEFLYELIRVSDGAVIALQNTSNTTATFTNGGVSPIAPGTFSLTSGTVVQYQVRVTDRLGPTASPTRSCPLVRDVPVVTPIVVPMFTLASNDVTCPTDNDGSVTFTLDPNNLGNTALPPTFRLYQFATLAEANAAEAAANGAASDYSMAGASNRSRSAYGPSKDRFYNRSNSWCV